MKNKPTALWRACPTPDGKHWTAWELYQLTPLMAAGSAGDQAFWRREAHKWARDDRAAWPGHLIAVRAYEAGPPVFSSLIADHYDSEPYA